MPIGPGAVQPGLLGSSLLHQTMEPYRWYHVLVPVLLVVACTDQVPQPRALDAGQVSDGLGSASRPALLSRMTSSYVVSSGLNNVAAAMGSPRTTLNITMRSASLAGTRMAGLARDSA